MLTIYGAETMKNLRYTIYDLRLAGFVGKRSQIVNLKP